VDTLPPPKASRRVHTGDAWHDDVPVYDGSTLAPGPALVGPAIVQYPFTTLLLRTGDTARMLVNGDVLVDVA
jgi:N-methylhydantoinase A/oxoprolinase/acetone carboxylase beta subunit